MLSGKAREFLATVVRESDDDALCSRVAKRSGRAISCITTILPGDISERLTPSTCCRKTLPAWPRISIRTSMNVSTLCNPLLNSAAEANPSFNSNATASSSRRSACFEVSVMTELPVPVDPAEKEVRRRRHGSFADAGWSDSWPAARLGSVGCMRPLGRATDRSRPPPVHRAERFSGASQSLSDCRRKANVAGLLCSCPPTGLCDVSKPPGR